MVSLAIGGLVAGCQYDPNARLLTTTEPRREDVLGTYVTDRFRMPPELVGKSAEISVELRADGSFVATNVPNGSLELPGKDYFSTLMSGTGQWKIDRMGGIDPGNRPIWGVYLRNRPPPTEAYKPGDERLNMHAANFTGDAPPYGLIFQIGDPDSGYAVFLKRK